MKNKKILLIVLVVVFILLGTKGFSRFRKLDIIDNVILLDNSRAEIPEDWRLILVNNKNSIPKDYKIELVQLSNGIYIDSRIYPDLQLMFDDAREDGVYPVAGEGYRTHEEQQNMMNDKIDSFIDEGYSKREAEKLAKDWVAEAGKSEHELGMALDINADISVSSDEEVYSWLAENSYKYGFILRYPPDKKYITGIDYEPWHYRYVGAESALEIYSRQITLEEYLGSYYEMDS
ncbi:MAG: M15 family metallopeptidase [Ruminococcus sp.]|nr:M15 family metallopeptidase [Ruminococcus sp.]